MIRKFFAYCIIIGMMGITIYDLLYGKDWKVPALGFLYAIANVIIFVL